MGNEDIDAIKPAELDWQWRVRGSNVNENIIRPPIRDHQQITEILVRQCGSAEFGPARCGIIPT
jgi:hypothetical protein